jgi:hypothetical protein
MEAQPGLEPGYESLAGLAASPFRHRAIHKSLFRNA